MRLHLFYWQVDAWGLAHHVLVHGGRTTRYIWFWPWSAMARMKRRKAKENKTNV